MAGGGAERVAATLANAWSDRGHHVTLMPTYSVRGESAYPLSPSVHLDFLSDHCAPTAGRLVRLLALRRLIGRRRPDVIVSFLPHVNIGAILASFRSDIPVIACERTFPPRLSPPLPRFYRLLRRITYPRAAALVAQTEHTASWLRDRAARTPIFIIPNSVTIPVEGSEPCIIPSSLVNEAMRVLLWVGRMDKAKRPEIAVEAFTILAADHCDWTFVMLGDGPVRSRLMEIIEKRRLENRIILPGFAGNLAAWYERSDLYVMTSSYEGFPNTLLEAMAYGKPCVAFDIPTGPAELSDQGRRLQLLRDEDHIEQLVSALRVLMSDATQRDALARSASEAKEIYSLGSILSQWDAIFTEVRQQN